MSWGALFPRILHLTNMGVSRLVSSAFSIKDVAFRCNTLILDNDLQHIIPWITSRELLKKFPGTTFCKIDVSYGKNLINVIDCVFYVIVFIAKTFFTCKDFC